MSDFTENVQYGDLLKNAYRQLLIDLNHRPVPNGVEDLFSLIMPELKKASFDKSDFESQSIAMRLRKRPDLLVWTPNNKCRIIEVRSKKDLPENHLEYFDDKYCDFFEVQKMFSTARLVYLDLQNEKVRSLYCGYEYNHPLQGKYWQDPCSYLYCSEDQFKCAEKKMWKAIKNSSKKVISYMSEEEDIPF